MDDLIVLSLNIAQARYDFCRKLWYKCKYFFFFAVAKRICLFQLEDDALVHFHLKSSISTIVQWDFIKNIVINLYLKI